MTIFKRRAKNKPSRMAVNTLKLNAQMYLSLLALQLLNLLTLVTQLHVVYLVFAVFVLVVQFTAHLRLKNKFFGSGAANKTANLSKSKGSTYSEHFYSAPKIFPSWLILLSAIGGSISLAITGRELGLLMSMVHLLCFAYSLKTFELPRRKDLYQLVVLGMFVVTSSLIFMQSVYFSIAVIILAFANFIVLMNFFSPSAGLKQQSKTLIKLVIFSIPLAIILFVGFPKLAPFWQVPSVKSAKVGLSDRVKIGDIAQLALSDELAFRVSFNNDAPVYSQQYWRAMVLDDFDGATWQQAKSANSNSQNQGLRRRQNSQINVDIQGPEVSYQVITEPSFQSWLFALDFATSEQANISQRADFALYYRGIINQTLSYKVTSYPEAILSKSLTSAQRKINLEIPVNGNPRLREKALQLRQQYNDNGQLINQVLSEFNQQQYFYTLQPPGLSGNTLDQFYFDTKAGFCEHYASAFTYLMRSAGIPARMVVGYLGGEVNPKGNYLSVYQRNAHAWSEVWLAGRGWMRVDPTAAVDPERIESGFSTSLLQEVNDLSSSVFSLQALQNAWLYNQLKQQLQALDYQWTRWVIGYTGERQNQVMKSIMSALRSLENVLYFTITALLLIFTGGFVKLFLVKNSNQSEWQQRYMHLLAILAKQQIIKGKSMTAMQFAEFVATQRPDISTHFTELSRYYCQLQYQQPVKNKHHDQVEAANSIGENSINEEQDALIGKFKQCYRTLRWQLLRTSFTAK
jgi:transglutaminase-like putative cysteine protease